MLKELYQELAATLSSIEDVKWVDLWHEQIGFLAEEHPFPTPALFIGFSSLEIHKYGKGYQRILMQVDVYVFHESFLDTFQGAYNQNDALYYMLLMDKVNVKLHGKDGETHKNMERIGFDRMESGGAGTLYKISFTCWVLDTLTVPEVVEEEYTDVRVSKLDNN